jgi:electron transfer flavoprotein alpha subunit
MNGCCVCVIAETNEQGLRECTLEAIGEGRTAADQLGCGLTLILIGHRLDRFIEMAAGQGADTVYLIDHPLLANYSTDGFVGALEESLVELNPRLTLVSATILGQDMAPRLAFRMRMAIITDCLWVKIGSQGETNCIKPAYQEKIHITYTFPPGQAVMASLRPGVIGYIPPRRSRPIELIRHLPKLNETMIRTQKTGSVRGDPHTIDLVEAESVVAGGRGIRIHDDWKLIEDLVDALGAAVGGSRLALDLGYIPRHRLIGQTGQSISPRLYLAVGISGTLHHTEGVKARVMIAINKDRGAPIFNLCDLGIVADLYDLLPALTRRIRQEKTSRQAGRL